MVTSLAARPGRMPRAVIAGCSHWHLPHYLNGIRTESEITAVFDRSAAFAGRMAAKVGARCVERCEDLWTPELADVAFVFVPHNEMTDTAVGFLSAGIPVVLEKPGGLSAQQVAKVQDAAQRHGSYVMVPFIQRLGPLPRLLERVGPLDHANFEFFSGPPGRYVEAQSEWVLDPVLAGGGCFLNLGVHFVDLFLQYTQGQKVQRVESLLSSRPHGTPVEVMAHVLIEMSGGTTANVSVSYTFPHTQSKRHVSYVFSGPGGTAEVGPRDEARFYGADGVVSLSGVSLDTDALYDAFTRRVFARIRSEEVDLPSIRDLHAVMEVLDRVYAHDL